MPSNSLLKNKYFDKLSLNRLKVNSLKVNKLFEKKHDCSCKKSGISNLFSLDLQKASWNSETNELTFSKGDALSLLRFTDRPYQFDKIFKDSDAVEHLDILFRSNPNSINSFEKNPPNGVLVAPEGQQAYNIKLQSVDDNGNVKLILDLFKDTDGNYVSQLKSFVDQKVSLFIDGYSSCSGLTNNVICRYKGNSSTTLRGTVQSDTTSPSGGVIWRCAIGPGLINSFRYGGPNASNYTANACMKSEPPV